MEQLELLQVAPLQETLHGGYCGPASLKMVLGYYGKEVAEDEVAAMCKRTVELGTDAESIAKAAESYGFTAKIRNESSLQEIETLMQKKIPVIVNWFTSGRADYGDSSVPDGHYSVVVGIDDQNVYLQDPEIGRLRTLQREDFMRVWFDFKGRSIASWDDLILRQIIIIS